MLAPGWLQVAYATLCNTILVQQLKYRSNRVIYSPPLRSSAEGGGDMNVLIML